MFRTKAGIALPPTGVMRPLLDTGVLDGLSPGMGTSQISSTIVGPGPRPVNTADPKSTGVPRPLLGSRRRDCELLRLAARDRLAKDGLGDIERGKTVPERGDAVTIVPADVIAGAGVGESVRKSG